MKKLINLSLVIIMLLIMILTTSTFASTKYDNIVNTDKWKNLMQLYENLQIPDHLINYLNFLINKNDLNRILKNKTLDKDKSEFLSKNSTNFLKYLYLSILNSMNNIKPTDAQFIYITGVINDPNAQVAKNGAEYEMEKALLREMPLYKLWEIYRESGKIEEIINEEIDLLYKHIQDKK